ncbi:maleylpyruvate isomerase N-terminal domain-containing protein [Nocardioides sp.]|uniref:maleylpyruvate isomerase N-terminal domain-containing protein n=1 Tax=Nocardioides sp. TaxID=35761 RepID=UPI0037839417
MTDRTPEQLADLLADTYDAFTAHVTGLAPAGLEQPTRAPAWNVRQLLFHQLLDAQRALVALATPASGEPDVDDVTYWRPFLPSGGGDDAAHARFVVAVADAYDGPRGLLAQWTATAGAAGHAARAADPEGRIATQGHVLTVPDFVSTLLVEATIHLLDAHGAPPPAAVAHTRRVLEAIDGEPLPPGSDAEVVRLR